MTKTNDEVLVVEVDAATGDRVERPATTAELADRLAMQTEFEAELAAKQAKLLGLTAEEIAAL